ncbi:hypothetical protein KA005_66360 [bacterium]|nr:hypothetical protein [bacterium]
MSITTRGNKPAAVDAPLWGSSSANISKPTTTLINAGYPLQASPGSANWNWLINFVSAGVVHNLIYGIASWDTGETYVLNSYVNHNGIRYKSRIAGNIGQTPGADPTKWHDTRSPLTVAISSTQTRTVQSMFDEVLNVDTSGGNRTVTLTNGLFNGQEVVVICDGTGMTYVKGSGALTGGKKSGIWDAASATGTPISDGLSLKLRWSVSLGIWIVVNEITAEWTSGVFQIEITSTGDLIQTVTANSGSITLNPQAGSTFFTGATYPIPFISVSKSYSHSTGTVLNFTTGSMIPANILLDTGSVFAVNITNIAASGAILLRYTREGKY